MAILLFGRLEFPERFVDRKTPNAAFGYVMHKAERQEILRKKTAACNFTNHEAKTLRDL
jgi:hypothetical protein